VIARIFCILAISLPVMAQAPQPDWRGLMRQVLSNLQNGDKALGEYGYQRFNVRRQFNTSGAITSERTFLARREYFSSDDLWAVRQIERNGVPVPQQELDQNLASIRQRAADLRAMTAAERAKLEEQSRRRERDETDWLKEFPEALDYRQIGEEMVDGRPAIVLECSPRPGYKASNLQARVFSKVRGKIWIDRADSQLVRADAEVYETVNIGLGVLGRVHKGTRFHIERRKVGAETWLPVSQTIRFAARVLLFKHLAQEEVTEYSRFRHKSELMAAR
jgi:hypothetical protein